MVIERRHLQQHLELAAQAYGSDLRLPAGRTTPRPAASPARAEPRPAEHSTPPAAEGVAAAPPKPVFPDRTARPAAASPPPAMPSRRPTEELATPELAGDAAEQLQALRGEVQPCTRCKLHEGRQHAVFGEGNPAAEVMFIGEAPGAREDQTGRPFVGEAGQLLDRILTGAMGLQRREVYIANINKCRPPGNRVPEPDEVAACLPFLRQQIAIIRPKVLVCLGRTAAQNLLATTASTTALRGRTLDYEGIPVVVTWHPAYLLREPAHKRETWEDIKRVNRLLGRPEVPPQAS